MFYSIYNKVSSWRRTKKPYQELDTSSYTNFSPVFQKKTKGSSPNVDYASVAKEQSETDNLLFARYKTDVFLENENDPRAIICNHYVTDTHSAILDVGCACGDLGVVLHKEKNAVLIGMEYMQESIAIAHATNAFEHVHHVDLNNFAAEDFKDYYNKFDYIVFGDVLEHINDPQETLENFKDFLKKNGAFLVSLPNISHASIKMNLLLDDWTYTDVGILDKTHIKFFTQKSIPSFLAEVGLKIIDMKYTVKDREGYQPNKPWKKLPIFVRWYIYKNPHSFIVQYVLKVVPSEKSIVPEELLRLNTEKLAVTNGNMTKSLQQIMLRRSPFWRVTKAYHKLLTFFTSV